jgi:hypothetical protein
MADHCCAHNPSLHTKKTKSMARKPHVHQPKTYIFSVVSTGVPIRQHVLPLIWTRYDRSICFVAQLHHAFFRFSDVLEILN